MLYKLKQKIATSWYQPTCWWTSLLLPLSWLFILISLLRRIYYRCITISKFNVPIIVVGNITVGGTGKTPLVIYLVQLLQQHGYRPGVISRGYGRSQHDYCIVTDNSDPNLVGDEPVLLAQRTKVPVIVGRKRVIAVQQLLKTTDCNIIISDDGLQHYALARSIEIAVIDGTRRLGNALRLPAGPLREAAGRLNAVDFIVTSGKADTGEYELSLSFAKLVNISTHQQKNFADGYGRKIFAVAGIGNNQRFFTLLTRCGFEVIAHSFPDHHNYRLSDFAALMRQPHIPIIMTEKDAVKCVRFATEQFWYLPVSAKLPAAFDQKVLAKL